MPEPDRYKDPLAGRSGNLSDLLADLDDEALSSYEGYWSERMESFKAEGSGGRYVWRGHIRGASAPGDFEGRYYWEP